MRFLKDFVKDYKELEKHFIWWMESTDYDYNGEYAYLFHLMGDDDTARKYIQIQFDLLKSSLDLIEHLETYFDDVYFIDIDAK